MEVAIRWSQRSTPSDPQFLIADVAGRTFKHCRISNYRNDSLQWEEISRNNKVPAFRAFDWSYRHAVVAVGQWSGETTVLGLDGSSSSTLPLPVKSQRQCNAVAFNSETLLATGLEKIRNDFCLHVYDVGHWLGDRGGKGQAPAKQQLQQQQAAEPVRKLASSEGIVSVKFFPGQPNELVAGVKGSFVRIYDLRDNSGSPAVHYQTTCVHNIAIDPSDQNYFASASPIKDSAVHIWDRRAALRPLQGHSGNQPSLDGPVLRLKDVFSGEKPDADAVNIWSLRYSQAESGCLGILGSGGNFRIFQTKKDYYEPMETAASPHRDTMDYAQGISVYRTETVAQLRHHVRRGSTGSAVESENQFSAFDFINVLSADKRPCALTLRGNQDVGIYRLRPPPPALVSSSRHEIIHSDASEQKLAKSISPIKGLKVEKPRKTAPIASLMTTLRPQFDRILSGRNTLTPEDGIDQLHIDDGWNDAPTKKAVNRISVAESTATDTTSPKSKSPPQLPISSVLVRPDLTLRRCKEGYLLNAPKNISILKDSKPLQDMWAWIGNASTIATNNGMVTEHLDLSYLGIFNIWNGHLGSLAEHRYKIDPSRVNVADNFKSLAITRDLWDVDFPKTSKPEQRKLCLLACGFETNPEEMVKRVKPLALAGRSVEGAFHALMGDDWQLAVTALRSGPRHQQNRALGSVITLFGKNEDPPGIQDQAENLLGDDPNPLTKAIVAYVSRIPVPHAVSVRLPAHYRAALAIKSASDADVTALVSERTQTALREGDVSAIVYTGLSGESLGLFTRYVEQTSDLQSAVLALAHVSPRFIRHGRIEHWRCIYRSELNSWKLFIPRAAFDMQSTKLSVNWEGTPTIAPQARQVMLRCSACDNPLHRDQNGLQASQGQDGPGGALPKAQTSNVLGSSREGTQCPRCGAGLPRCVVCDHRTGVVDPLTKGGLEAEKKARESGDAFFDNNTELCLTCKHVYHRGHAQQWFARNVECAAVDCSCRCGEVDGKSASQQTVF